VRAAISPLSYLCKERERKYHCTSLYPRQICAGTYGEEKRGVLGFIELTASCSFWMEVTYWDPFSLELINTVLV
jgi:hypothetical protein